MAKFIIISLISILLQVISGQSIGKVCNAGLAVENAAYNGLPYNQLAANGLPYPANGLPYPANGVPQGANGLPQGANGLPYPANGFSNGGGFVVASSSPIAASGITVHSDNLIVEGPLAVSGQMPFLGVVAVEGPLQAVGQGSVAYGCGNGNVGITSELEPGYVNGPILDIGANINGIPKRPVIY